VRYQLVSIVIATPFSRIARFLPPVVVGAVITVIGLSLIDVAAGLVDQELTPSALRRGLMADGLSGIFAGFCNSFLDTVLAQNIGLITSPGCAAAT
jgi:xanthine/uracil permease